MKALLLTYLLVFSGQSALPADSAAADEEFKLLVEWANVTPTGFERKAMYREFRLEKNGFKRLSTHKRGGTSYSLYEKRLSDGSRAQLLFCDRSGDFLHLVRLGTSVVYGKEKVEVLGLKWGWYEPCLQLRVNGADAEITLDLEEKVIRGLDYRKSFAKQFYVSFAKSGVVSGLAWTRETGAARDATDEFDAAVDKVLAKAGAILTENRVKGLKSVLADLEFKADAEGSDRSYELFGKILSSGEKILVLVDWKWGRLRGIVRTGEPYEMVETKFAVKGIRKKPEEEFQLVMEIGGVEVTAPLPRTQFVKHVEVTYRRKLHRVDFSSRGKVVNVDVLGPEAPEAP